MSQSPIDIIDQNTKVVPENLELILEGFEAESSNKTWMKNTGKTGKCLAYSAKSIFICACVCMFTIWNQIKTVK